MTVAINRSFWQRQQNSIAPKLSEIKIKPESYHVLYMCKLSEIVRVKKLISKDIGWYLKNKEKFGVKLDIDRKCRALGIPAFISGINIQNSKLNGAYDTIHKLDKYAMKRNGGTIKSCRVDMNELVIYAKMYRK